MEASIKLRGLPSFHIFTKQSLSSMPDISNWKTNNITDMRDMFYGCSSLSYLPDISKWNTSKVTKMSDIFNGCCSLSYLPDISKWNTSKLKNVFSKFYKYDIYKECISLLNIPDE